jgi:hypothetical protein
LINYDHVPHDNYQFLTDCRTEYYFRYEGTSTYPPCFTESGGRTNVWRFMKDPIKVHPKQIEELHRLLLERIAPKGSYDGSPRECQPDTAAKKMDDGSAWVARNLQELDVSGPGSDGHDNYLCECDDWGSKVSQFNCGKGYCHLRCGTARPVRLSCSMLFAFSSHIHCFHVSALPTCNRFPRSANGAACTETVMRFVG